VIGGFRTSLYCPKPGRVKLLLSPHPTHTVREVDMAEAKTQPTTESLASYLQRIEDPARRADCEAVADLMAKVTKKPAVIWGTSIVGFGTYQMEYANGKTGDWPVLAFAARKNDITLYLSKTVMDEEDLATTLGKAKQQGGCLHIKKLSDVNPKTLKELMVKTANGKKISA